MDEAFRKDLSHLTWHEIYARQAQRAHLVDGWMEGLRIKGGDRVLEVGAGPGFVSLILSERIGPDGIVYAVDRSAEALTQLERRQNERGLDRIKRITADAATLDPASIAVNAVLITMVLHHADDPARLVENVARFVPHAGTMVIGEFHPDGPCSSGPPREHRLAPDKVEGWCKRAGLSVAGYRRQSDEHYMMVAAHP
jgi:ubiquinone/menaquinone biosynthesis C-methylase UbiE